MVLLDSDMVATSADCCCGCSECCFADGIVSPPCVDDDGNCWTGFTQCFGEDNCTPSGQCAGEIVPCDSLWRTFTNSCCCGGPTCFQTVDPITCEFVDHCVGTDPCEPCPESGFRCGTVMVSDQCVPCGACCSDGPCFIGTEAACDAVSGVFHAGFTCGVC